MNWSRFKLSEETLKDTLQVGCELLFAVVFIFFIASIDSIEERFSKPPKIHQSRDIFSRNGFLSPNQRLRRRAHNPHKPCSKTQAGAFSKLLT